MVEFILLICSRVYLPWLCRLFAGIYFKLLLHINVSIVYFLAALNLMKTLI